MLENLRTKSNKKNRSEIHARNYIFLNYVEVKLPSKHVQNSLKKIYQKSKEKNLRKKKGPKDFFIRTCLNYVEEKKEKKKTKRKKATLKKPPNFPCQKKQRALNFAYQNLKGLKNFPSQVDRRIRVYSWLSFVEWEAHPNYIGQTVEREAGGGAKKEPRPNPRLAARRPAPSPRGAHFFPATAQKTGQWGLLMALRAGKWGGHGGQNGGPIAWWAAKTRPSPGRPTCGPRGSMRWPFWGHFFFQIRPCARPKTPSARLLTRLWARRISYGPLSYSILWVSLSESQYPSQPPVPQNLLLGSFLYAFCWGAAVLWNRRLADMLLIHKVKI